jgi:hypothetical protein
MSVNGGKDRDDAVLVAALATGKNYRQAAHEARVSVRTVERRMAFSV